MPEQDFLTFASAGGANVLSQSAWVALSEVPTGFVSGILPSTYLNKALRQPSIMAAVIGDFIVQETGLNVIDDGTTSTILANFTTAVGIVAQTVTGSVEFIGSGSGTFTVPGGVYAIDVSVNGSGGGGGGCSAGYGAAGGGGGGGFSRSILGVTPGEGLSYRVDSGGTGGTPGTAGSAGGSTSFGPLSVNGGNGGNSAGSGGIGTGGSGGSGTGGNINATGGNGLSGALQAISGGGTAYFGGVGGWGAFGIGVTPGLFSASTGNAGGLGGGGGGGVNGGGGGMGGSGGITIRWGL